MRDPSAQPWTERRCRGEIRFVGATRRLSYGNSVESTFPLTHTLAAVMLQYK